MTNVMKKDKENLLNIIYDTSINSDISYDKAVLMGSGVIDIDHIYNTTTQRQNKISKFLLDNLTEEVKNLTEEVSSIRAELKKIKENI